MNLRLNALEDEKVKNNSIKLFEEEKHVLSYYTLSNLLMAGNTYLDTKHNPITYNNICL